MADGLLDVHMLAGLARPDGRESMPVVASSDGYRIDVPVFEHASQVLLERGLLAGQRFTFAGPLLHAGLVRIAKSRHFHTGNLGAISHVVASATTKADDRYPDAIVDGRPRSRSSQQMNAAGRGCVRDEVSSSDWHEMNPPGPLHSGSVQLC